jgi:hypothetical protein
MTRPIPIGLCAAWLLGAAGLACSAPAGGVAASASARADAGAAAPDTGARADAGETPEDAGETPEREEPWPDKPSPRPRHPAEWKLATPLHLARAERRCKALRLREWVRIDCGGVYAALLGGSAAGVELYEGKVEPGTFAIFPVRRGDRRLIEFGTTSGAASKYTVELDNLAVVSELWLPGDDGPVITIH